jgi:hypothetical protein
LAFLAKKLFPELGHKKFGCFWINFGAISFAEF